jgi:RNA polymerase sigma factor (TIGR02999 family)
VGVEDPGWKSRGHFFAAAAEAMRRILVENARRKRAAKRTSGGQRVELDPAHLTLVAPPDEVLAIDEALTRLAHEDSTAARLVELRYFAGLTVEEAAHAMGLSRTVAYRHWTYARAWIRHEIQDEDPENP